MGTCISHHLHLGHGPAGEDAENSSEEPWGKTIIKDATIFLIVEVTAVKYIVQSGGHKHIWSSKNCHFKSTNLMFGIVAEMGDLFAVPVSERCLLSTTLRSVHSLRLWTLLAQQQPEPLKNIFINKTFYYYVIFLYLKNVIH